MAKGEQKHFDDMRKEEEKKKKSRRKGSTSSDDSIDERPKEKYVPKPIVQNQKQINRLCKKYKTELANYTWEVELEKEFEEWIPPHFRTDAEQMRWIAE